MTAVSDTLRAVVHLAASPNRQSGGQNQQTFRTGNENTKH
jgi:hypothetical protein